MRSRIVMSVLTDDGSGPHDGAELLGIDVELKAPAAQVFPLGRKDRVEADVGRRQAGANTVQIRRRRHLVGLQQEPQPAHDGADTDPLGAGAKTNADFGVIKSGDR